jgi:type IV pilus assembly protein PilA
MKRLQQGFTLIELMIVVAIVGILAAIALPAYQDYIIRSKISEVAAAVGACKTSVAEFVATKGSLPSTTEAGCSDSGSQYLTAGGGWGGSTIAYASNTNAGAQCTLILTPSGIVGNAIPTWTGSNTGTNCSKYVPSSFR